MAMIASPDWTLAPDGMTPEQFLDQVQKQYIESDGPQDEPHTGDSLKYLAFCEFLDTAEMEIMEHDQSCDTIHRFEQGGRVLRISNVIINGHQWEFCIDLADQLKIQNIDEPAM